MRIVFFMVLASCSAAVADMVPSTYDTIWGAAKLYENADNPTVQHVALKGRIQGDAVAFHSKDASLEEFVWRRFRFGVQAGLFADFTVHAEADLDLNDLDDFYKRLTDSYLGWKHSETLQLKVGKHSTPFTLDGSTSSTKLLTPERSVVAVNLWFPTEYFTGVGVYGTANGWNWRAGAYSASGNDEFGRFDSGYFALLSGGCGLGKNGSLRVDYVYNDPDHSGNVGTRDLAHVLSLVYKQQLGDRLGLWSDLTMAKGLGPQTDLVGLELMPFYDLTERLQLVFQYAGVVGTDGSSGVLMGRYPSKVPGAAAVEASHNLLLGLNWFLYGHKLKWQNAMEYNHGANLDEAESDYNGWGLTSAVRISW